VPLLFCPVCGSGDWRLAVPADQIETEIRRRKHFVYSRLQRRANKEELKDLTDFMHGTPVPVLACRACGVLRRDEAAVRATASYEEDPNHPDLMHQVYPRYLQAFRNKATALRDRLRPHASVLEVGSHLGAFLQVAEEWDWRPVGLDIGQDTADFARSNGLTVRRETIDGSRLPASSFDAVFIWNCFEQLTDPADTLKSAHRLLRRFGLLVLRVPNATFYRTMRRVSQRWLAWNNLLGFPYLYGYTARALDRIAARNGFEPVRGFNSELVTMPFPELSASLAAEQIEASKEVAAVSTAATLYSGALIGPWIDVICRKQSEVTKSRSCADLRFLERAA
jgi:SAM-dependent methyltransferase